MNRLFQNTLIVIFTAAGASVLAVCFLAIFVHQDLSHPESMVQWAVREVAAGDELYPDLRQWPHRLMPYGPLLCYPIGLVLKVAGVDTFGFHIYLLGRGQSLAYLLGILAVCMHTLKSAGVRRLWALMLTGSYAALWSGILVPSTSFRADFPALFWALVAAYVAFGFNGDRRRAYLAIAPFLLSVMYKPSFWAFPAAFCIFYWIYYGFKPAFFWGLSLVAALVVYVSAAQWLTDGLFLLNQIGGSSLGVTNQLFVISRDLLLNPVGFPLLSWDLCLRVLLAMGAAAWLLRRHQQPLVRGFAIYYLVALPVNLLTFFKVGAGLNYALEAYILAGLVLGFLGQDVYSRLPTLRPVVKASWVAVFLLLFLLPVLYFTFQNTKAAIETAGKLETPKPLVKLLALPGTALLGDQAFTHPAVSAHALSDPVPFAHLSMKELIPREPLADRVRSRQFSHFVMSPGMKYLFFSPEKANWVGLLLEEYYKLETVVPEYEIWIPKESDAAQTSGTASLASTE